MRELKTESQSIRTTQVQPGLKKSQPPQTADDVAAQEAIALKPLNSEAAEAHQPTPEATPKRGRKPTSKQTVSKTKRSTTPKSKPATTQVRLTWDAPEPSRNSFGVAVRFQQLEHELQQLKSQADQINQQSVEIQTEMEELRTIAHEVTQQRLAPSSYQLNEPAMPPFMQTTQQPLPTTHKAPIPSEILQNSVRSATAESSPTLRSGGRVAQPSSQPRRSLTPRRRRRLRHYLHHLHRFTPSLELPKKPIARFWDALLWTLAAAGLRIGLNFLVSSLPFLAIPLSLLMFLPAIAAAYLAVFVPRSSPALLYRLLLVTFGLFIGGKLI